MNNVLQYKNYYGSVHYSANDEVFYGKVMDIGDLVSFEGTSVQELKSAFQEAVDDYLETCTSLNKEPEIAFHVPIPKELHRQAMLEASTKGMSLDDFVRHALTRAMGV